MRALMGRIGFVVLLVVVASTAHAQFRDTLQVGDRVRVRVAATHGTTNLFVGNLSSVSADTLVLDIPGGKGSIILPRAAVAEVALSQGNESRWRSVARILPFVGPPAAMEVVSPPEGPHRIAFRNRQIFMIAALPVIAFARTPRERWEPVYRWLQPR